MGRRPALRRLDTALWRERSNCCSRCALQCARESCSEQNLKTVLSVWRIFLKEIAESLIGIDNDVLTDFNVVARDTTYTSALRWKNLVRELRNAAHPTIRVPTLRAGITFETLQIAKGTLDVRNRPTPACPKRSNQLIVTCRNGSYLVKLTHHLTGTNEQASSYHLGPQTLRSCHLK